MIFSIFISWTRNIHLGDTRRLYMSFKINDIVVYNDGNEEYIAEESEEEEEDEESEEEDA